jgi:hypothetical protein
VTPLAAIATAAGLLVSTTLLVVVVVFLWWLDRYDREPLLVAGAFLWGGVAAAVLSVSALSAAAAALDAPLGTLAGAALEELLKATAVVLVARYSAEFDSPTDGLVYGTARAKPASKSAWSPPPRRPVVADRAPVIERTLFSAGVHGLASGVVGGFVGLAHLSRGTLARVAWTAGGLAIGIALHGGWNAGVLPGCQPGALGRTGGTAGALRLLPRRLLAAAPVGTSGPFSTSSSRRPASSSFHRGFRR